MKTKNKIVLLLIAIVLSVATMLSGCATTVVQQGEKTTDTMQALENEGRQFLAQIDKTNASLQAVIDPNPGDIKTATQAYIDNVNSIQGMAEKLGKRADSLKANKEAYFAEWEQTNKTYTNSQIRQLSTEQKQEIHSRFNEITDASVGLRDATNAYLSNLQDIKTYLQTVPATQGIATISDHAQKTIQQGNTLKESFTPVLNLIAEVRGEISTTPQQ
ncbi:MAG: DUF2959 domain-containing protein [Desulfuromonadales bacterium]|nr:DUF2959 domain-containing protein [Desulfuromonadales bacterium]